MSQETKDNSRSKQIKAETNIFAGQEDDYIIEFDPETKEIVAIVEVMSDGSEQAIKPDSSKWNTVMNDSDTLEAYNVNRFGANTDAYVKQIGSESVSEALDGANAIGNNEILTKNYKINNNSLTNLDKSNYGMNKNDVELDAIGQDIKDKYDAKTKSLDKVRVFRYPLDIAISQDHLEISRFNYQRTSVQGSRPARLITDVRKEAKYDNATSVRQSGANEKSKRFKNYETQTTYSERKGDSMKGSKYYGTVFLPMPKVVDTNGADWGKSELNILGLAAASLGEGLGQIALDQESEAELSNAQEIVRGLTGEKTTNLKDIGGALASQFYASTVARATGQNVTTDQLLARSSGRVLNPNAEMLFQGPVLRDFNFDFTLIARSPEEGKEIRKIIKFFKDGMAPKFNNSTFLTTPDIFILKYKRGGADDTILKTVNRFNPGGLALKTFAVDYAPNGYWSAYQDSQPISLKMTMNFTELRPIYFDDQVEDGMPEDAVGY